MLSQRIASTVFRRIPRIISRPVTRAPVDTAFQSRQIQTRPYPPVISRFHPSEQLKIPHLPHLRLQESPKQRGTAHPRAIPTRSICYAMEGFAASAPDASTALPTFVADQITMHPEIPLWAKVHAGKVQGILRDPKAVSKGIAALDQRMTMLQRLNPSLSLPDLLDKVLRKVEGEASLGAPMVLDALVPPDDFLGIIRSGSPLDDPGASPGHGRHTHRVQRFIVHNELQEQGQKLRWLDFSAEMAKNFELWAFTFDATAPYVLWSDEAIAIRDLDKLTPYKVPDWASPTRDARTPELLAEDIRKSDSLVGHAFREEYASRSGDKRKRMFVSCGPPDGADAPRRALTDFKPPQDET